MNTNLNIYVPDDEDSGWDVDDVTLNGILDNPVSVHATGEEIEADLTPPKGGISISRYEQEKQAWEECMTSITSRFQRNTEMLNNVKAMLLQSQRKEETQQRELEELRQRLDGNILQKTVQSYQDQMLRLNNMMTSLIEEKDELLLRNNKLNESLQSAEDSEFYFGEYVKSSRLVESLQSEKDEMKEENGKLKIMLHEHMRQQEEKEKILKKQLEDIENENSKNQMELRRIQSDRSRALPSTTTAPSSSSSTTTSTQVQQSPAALKSLEDRIEQMSMKLTSNQNQIQEMVNKKIQDNIKLEEMEKQRQQLNDRINDLEGQLKVKESEEVEYKRRLESLSKSKREENEHEISRLYELIDSNAKKVSERDSTIVSLNTRISTMQGDMERMKLEERRLNAEIDGIHAQQRVNGLNSMRESVEQEKKTLMSQIQSLEQKLELSSSDSKQWERKEQEFNQSVEQLKSQIDTLQKQLIHEKETHQQQQQQQQQQQMQQQQQQQQHSLESQLSSQKELVEQSLKRIQELELENKRLNESAITLQKDHASQLALAQRSSSDASVQQNVVKDQLKNEIDELKSQNGKFQAEIKETTSQLTKSHQELKSLQEKQKESENEKSGLNTMLSELKNQIEAKDKEMKELMNRNSELELNLANAVQLMDVLQSQLNTTQSVDPSVNNAGSSGSSSSSGANTSELQADIEKLTQELKTVKEQLARAEEDRKKAEELVDALKSGDSAANKRIVDYHKDRAKKLADEVKTLTEEKKQLEEASSRQRSDIEQQWSNRLKESETIISKLKSEKQALELLAKG